MTAGMVFLCPFCGLRASVIIPSGERATYIVHALPSCRVFDLLEPLPYMEAVNQRLASHGN